MCVWTSLPAGYHLSIIDVGLVLEYLIGVACCSSFTKKTFKAASCHLQEKDSSTTLGLSPVTCLSFLPSLQKGRLERSKSLQQHGLVLNSGTSRSLLDLYFLRTAQPYKAMVLFFYICLIYITCSQTKCS